MTRTTRLSSERDPGREDAKPGILPDVAYFAYGEYYMHILHIWHIIHIWHFLLTAQQKCQWSRNFPMLKIQALLLVLPRNSAVNPIWTGCPWRKGAVCQWPATKSISSLTRATANLRIQSHCLAEAWPLDKPVGLLVWLCTGLTYLLKIQVSDSKFIYHMHIMYINYFCTYYAYHDFSFPFAGHSDSMVVFKSSAYYALSHRECALIELVLCACACGSAFDYELYLRPQ